MYVRGVRTFFRGYQINNVMALAGQQFCFHYFNSRGCTQTHNHRQNYLSFGKHNFCDYYRYIKYCNCHFSWKQRPSLPTFSFFNRLAPKYSILQTSFTRYWCKYLPYFQICFLYGVTTLVFSKLLLWRCSEYNRELSLQFDQLF